MRLRAQLASLGHGSGRFRYRDFVLRPTSLRTAMRSMSTPGRFAAVPVPADRQHDTWWAEEAQGIAQVGAHWIISTNPLWTTPAAKALYTFPLSSGFRDDDVLHKFTIDDDSVPVPGGVFHVGALTWHRDTLWVDHWNDAGAQVLRFRVEDGVCHYLGHIPLVHRSGHRVALVAIDPWRRGFLTARSDRLEPSAVATPHVGVGPEPTVLIRRQPVLGDRLFLHDADGNDTGVELPLDPPITDTGYAQGGFFSANGHLYLASGRSGITPRQYIYGYHALTGKRFAEIEVIAESASQELEGCAAVAVDWNGYPVRMVALLLENEHGEYDDCYFKAFVAERPDFL